MRRSLALQEETGKGLGFTPRVLPDAESKRLRAVYDKQTTPEGRLQNLRGLQQQGGIYSQRMLTEMKMPESVVAIAPALPILPDKDSGLWLTAAEIKPSDIPNVNEDAKKNARDAIANSSAMSFFYGMARKFPTNTVLRDLAKNMEATVQNALLLGMEPGALDKAWSSAVSYTHLDVYKRQQESVRFGRRLAFTGLFSPATPGLGRYGQQADYHLALAPR